MNKIKEFQIISKV